MILPPLLSDGEAEIPLLSAVLLPLLCGFGARGSEYQIRGSECDVRHVRSQDSLVRSHDRCFRSHDCCFRSGDFFENHQSSFSIKEGFFRKPTSPPLPLREGPPLISVFSPQGRRGNRSSSSLVTISFYGWRTIRGLASSRAAFCGMRPHGHELLRGCESPEAHSSSP